MKFIIDKDTAKIVDRDILNSGSVNYYDIEIEHDSSWNNLSIEAITIKDGDEKGNSVAVINNHFYLDKQTRGAYFIGFIGYTLEERQIEVEPEEEGLEPTTETIEVKIYQISTNLVHVLFEEGAGEIDTSNQEEVPTPTEWETYLAQVQEFIDDGNEIINQANNLDISNTGTIVTITKKDGTTSEINVKGDKGDTGNTGAPGRDGRDGQDGAPGRDGTNGTDGADGFSPIAIVQSITGGATVSITDKNGTTTANIYNGQNGQNGTNGQDGYTPVRGTDYWTSADISAMEQYCANYIDQNITQAIGGEY